MSHRLLINGKPGAWVSARDRGLHYGDGLFETIAIRDGEPLLWEAHLERLMDGCRRLGIPPPEPALLREESESLCRDHTRAVLKLILTRGPGERGYATTVNVNPTRILQLSPWPDYPDNRAAHGVSVTLCHTRLGCNPALAGLKHLNRLEQVLARQEWGREYAEGLMLDTEDRLIEGIKSNVFLVKDGGLSTPDLGTCGVAGVMRARILDAARALGMTPRIAELSLHDAQTADELFLSNSLIGIWPVIRLQQHSYTIGAVTRALQNAIMKDCCPATVYK